MRSTLVLVIALSFALIAPAGAWLAPDAAATSTPAFLEYPLPTDLAGSAAEPSIGVNWNTGAVFFQSGERTIRGTFDDTSMPPSGSFRSVEPLWSVENLDPYVFTDAKSGRTFAGGILHGCSLMGYTDDDGESWVPMADACALPAFDHESIASGPWKGAAPPGAVHDRAVYYCAQYIIPECAVSYDGGLTFRPSYPLSTGTCTNFAFPVEVASDGTGYVPVRKCGTVRGLGTTVNNGLTWEVTLIPGSSMQAKGFDPAAVITDSGRLYYSWVGSDGQTYVTVTDDPRSTRATWTTPFAVSQSSGITQTVFTSIVAGDDDRAAIAFLGTTTPGNAFAEGFTGVWHLYVALTYDGGATWQVQQVTSDPVQRGWICADGINCPDNGSRGRNLLDFIDAAVDADGRVLVAYADGCIGPCALPSGTIAMSDSRLGVIVRMTCGPSLFAAKGNVEGLRTCDLGGAPQAVPLTGTWYATGTAPHHTVDGLADIASSVTYFKRAAPTATAPKVAPNQAAFGGNTAGTIYDAHWYLHAPATGWSLSVTDVHVKLFVDVAGPPTGTPLRPAEITVAIYDATETTFAPLANAIASKTIVFTGGPGVHEIDVTFPAVTATLGAGFELFVGAAGAGDVVVLYDSVSTPTRVTFS